MPEELQVEVGRLVERLRSMPLTRLAAAIDPGTPSRGELARDLAQHLADAAAVIEGRPARVIPHLGDEYAGDQVAVTGHDLITAAAAPARRAVARTTEVPAEVPAEISAELTVGITAECTALVRALRLRL